MKTLEGKFSYDKMSSLHFFPSLYSLVFQLFKNPMDLRREVSLKEHAKYGWTHSANHLKSFRSEWKLLLESGDKQIEEAFLFNLFFFSWENIFSWVFLFFIRLMIETRWLWVQTLNANHHKTCINKMFMMSSENGWQVFCAIIRIFFRSLDNAGQLNESEKKSIVKNVKIFISIVTSSKLSGLKWKKILKCNSSISSVRKFSRMNVQRNFQKHFKERIKEIKISFSSDYEWDSFTHFKLVQPTHPQSTLKMN